MKKIMVVLVLSCLFIACEHQTENKEITKNPSLAAASKTRLGMENVVL